MNNETVIKKNIQINETHIRDFPLTISNGTKRMKEKFYRNAANERNKYIEKEKKKFHAYQKRIYYELNSRVEKLLPIDQSDHYQEEKERLRVMESLLQFFSSSFNSSYKLGFSSLIYSIREDHDVSLAEINSVLKQFLSICQSASVVLTIHDFSYSMFVEKYMTVFLQNQSEEQLNDLIKQTFEEIYWECPEFTRHIRLNLLFILRKYQKEFDLYIERKKKQMMIEQHIDQDKILSEYMQKRKSLLKEIAKDPFYHLNNFLDKKKNILDYLNGAPTRIKNFNQFTFDGNYDQLSSLEQKKYQDEIVNFSDTLQVLKEYYRYEFVILDMIEKFRKKDESKGAYEQKLKEIQKVEKKRSKLYQEYRKAAGGGFFKKVHKEKSESLKLQMNTQINHLHQLYQELDDLEIMVKIQEQLTDSSSLEDLLLTSFCSYPYMNRIFNEHFSEDDTFSFSRELERYFQFLYNPDNVFLRRVHAFAEYDISSVVAEKYRLLGLNISKTDVFKDLIDTTIEVVSFITCILFIEAGSLSLDDMYFISRFKAIEPIPMDDEGSIDVI